MKELRRISRNIDFDYVTVFKNGTEILFFCKK